MRGIVVKIFLSYGHDQNTQIALRIKHDLEAAGHVVWIDSSEIKAGDDWRRSIIDGLSDSDWTLGFLSRHSVRNPGVCLDELAIALHVKGGTIATVLVEAEAAVELPISIGHVQWLDMRDWAARLAENSEAGEQWYRSKLDKILLLLADPKTQRFAGEIAELATMLKPISQEADIGALIDGFIGREWLKSKLDNWCKNDRNSRLFWISGAPGTGKSAFAAWLAHFGRINVIALNLCRYNIDERRDPAQVLRTVAFQIATRLPDYRRLLLDRLKNQDLDAEKLDGKSAAALFDLLLAEPLRFSIEGGRRKERCLVIIDALDETIRDGRSTLAEVLAESCQKLPDWIAVVVTSRPEPSILRQFAGLNPQIISAESEDNLNDLRTCARRWLAIESRGAGESDARVERMVAASQGNFLYLRKLQEAVTSGLIDLAHPDGLPQGLVGLYERWFWRQFRSAGQYEAYRPFLEVLVAAGRPIPEDWLGRILGWTKLEQAKTLEGMGSLAERRPEGITLFHKSLRDWLTDDRSAGADFMIDAASGAKRLTHGLLSEFESWTKVTGSNSLNRFCKIELIYQLTQPQSDPAQLHQFVRLLSDLEVIRRRMLIDTDADEYRRRDARQEYQNLIELTASAWPPGLDASELSSCAEGLAKAGLQSLEGRLNGLENFYAWLDCESHPQNIHKFKDWLAGGHFNNPPTPRDLPSRQFNQLNEWNEATMILLTAIKTVSGIASIRPELVPSLPLVMDRAMRDFLKTLPGIQSYIFQSTAGIDYIPQRNMSFLRDEVWKTAGHFSRDPRLAAWADEWSGVSLT